jgi:hypothetical protein
MTPISFKSVPKYNLSCSPKAILEVALVILRYKVSPRIGDSLIEQYTVTSIDTVGFYSYCNPKSIHFATA